MAVMFTNCEQPEGSAALIGRWNLEEEHWVAEFRNDGVMYVSSTQYDTEFSHIYSATSDSLWIGDPSEYYPCSYYFESNNVLIIDGYDELIPQIDWVQDSIKYTVRTKWIRAVYSK